MLIEQALDGDNAVESRVARLPHLTHAAGTEAIQQRIGAEFIAGLQRHLIGSV